MTTSIFYLGTLPKSSQVVSKELQSRGISLLKAAPSDISPLVLSDSTPSYGIYKHSLSSYIRAAELGTPVLMNDPYHLFTARKTPGFMADPKVVWGYNTPLPNEARDKIKSVFKAVDTIVKGKPGLEAELSLDEVRDLITEYNPVQTFPTNLSAINIAAFKQYILLHRLFDTVCRTHQYSFDDKDRPSDTEIEYNSLKKVDHMEVDSNAAWSQFFIASNPRMTAYSNTVVKHADFDYTIKSSAAIPADAKGLMFPFVAELAQPDYATPIRVIDKYLKYCLGNTEDEVQEAFDRLLSSWTVLAVTSWGIQLAHMYWCLGIALESGATLRVISSTSDDYNGCMLIGSLSIHFREVSYYSAPRDTLVRDFGKASPHDSALTAIFAKIFYSGTKERNQAMKLCSNLHDVREQLSKQGTAEEGREEIRRCSFYVTFPDDLPPLTYTAFNVARVLEAIDNLEIDETKFPIYPPAILFSERRDRLWSAFGSLAPSFRVPGGKKMNLGDTFQVTERGKGGEKSARSVKKIGFVLRDLKDAIQDLITTMDDKTIFNPHGASIMSRASSSALVKTFEGDSCEKVVFGLRRVCKLTVSEGSGTGKGKRKADTETGEESNLKKSRADDL